MYSYNKQVRAALRQHPDGLTTGELHGLTGAPQHSIGKLLPTMPDAYIDRYLKSAGRGRAYIPVWSVVVPPENCPKPERKKK
jgi:hypothetical protein